MNSGCSSIADVLLLHFPLLPRRCHFFTPFPLDQARTTCVPLELAVAAGESRVVLPASAPQFVTLPLQEWRAAQEVALTMSTQFHPHAVSFVARYDDERERERERRAVELDDRGATARRQELRRQDKEEEEAEASKRPRPLFFYEISTLLWCFRL